jgi:hypothetical protein
MFQTLTFTHTHNTRNQHLFMLPHTHTLTLASRIAYYKPRKPTIPFHTESKANRY